MLSAAPSRCSLTASSSQTRGTPNDNRSRNPVYQAVCRHVRRTGHRRAHTQDSRRLPQGSFGPALPRHARLRLRGVQRQYRLHPAERRADQLPLRALHGVPPRRGLQGAAPQGRCSGLRRAGAQREGAVGAQARDRERTADLSIGPRGGVDAFHKKSTNRPGRWFHKSRAPPLPLHIKMLMFRSRGFYFINNREKLR